MSKDPAVLFYTSDFLTGITLLNMQERGEYITLLCLQHQKGNLSLEEITQITNSKKVKEKFVLAEDGKYHNPRMHEEKLKRQAFCESRRASRLIGIKQQRKRTNQRTSNVRSTYVQRTENENEDENINVIETHKDIQDIEDISNNKQDINIYSEIINYLNKKAGTHFKTTSKETIKLIKARIAAGFTITDFKTVLDNKSNWLTDPKMAEYYRPITLFGTKFESYLNEKQVDFKNQIPLDPVTAHNIAVVNEFLERRGNDD